jgi:hypothetical protein
MKDPEIKELLEQVLMNQYVMYRQLDDIENKLKNSSRMASEEIYARELKRKAEKFRDKLDN